MNILPINNNQPTFNARLFAPNGIQMKAFNMTDVLSGVDLMSSKGSKATDIFIKSFESKPYADIFDNFARITIKNPLFGTQELVQDLCDKTNTPKNKIFDLEENAERLTGALTKNCEILEDKALSNAILDKISERRKTFDLYRDDARELSPINVFEEMLTKVKPEEHGFSEKRISELRKQANLLQGQILMEGTKNI